MPNASEDPGQVPSTWPPTVPPPPWAAQPKPPAPRPAPLPPFDVVPTSRPSLAIAAGLIVLALLAALVTLAPVGSGGGGGGGTPEATLRSWAAAVIDGDYAKADSYLVHDRASSGANSQLLVAVCGKLSSVDVLSTQPSGSFAIAWMTLHFQSGRSITWSPQMVLANGEWQIDSNPSGIACY